MSRCKRCGQGNGIKPIMRELSLSKETVCRFYRGRGRGPRRRRRFARREARWRIRRLRGHAGDRGADRNQERQQPHRALAPHPNGSRYFGT
jgi:hypothetical protein